jgi:hypothetical protein
MLVKLVLVVKEKKVEKLLVNCQMEPLLNGRTTRKKKGDKEYG